nr:MAG TPA_asm: hypothetical protein [Caudoviricetes sp.]
MLYFLNFICLNFQLRISKGILPFYGWISNCWLSVIIITT